MPLVNASDDERAHEIALRTLFEQQEAALLRYAFSLVGRRAVAEEIVQEVFLRLHARWSDVAEPTAWLFRAARNQALDHLRRSTREVFDGNGAGDRLGPGLAQSQHTAPDAPMQHMETVAALRNMLHELDETDQQLVRLKYFENLKYRDISARTGLTVGNVGYRLHHILKELARKLRPLGIDGHS